MPFIAEHWERLMPNRQQSLNWPTHIYRALTTESVFSSETEGEETFYSLAEEVGFLYLNFLELYWHQLFSLSLCITYLGTYSIPVFQVSSAHF